ncbi:hypothetical protein C8Q78DRAFT_1014344 [Trametes maxima]|nr:hypothetical protein C8Q78DRAFT_1014343 [Trametes maxima]KAI0674346.1 hypothetical protein C8Q78DRAFT_1014344 [Trametes maxima]
MKIQRKMNEANWSSRGGDMSQPGRRVGSPSGDLPDLGRVGAGGDGERPPAASRRTIAPTRGRGRS